MKLTSLNELIEKGKTVRGSWKLTPDHELRYRSDGPGEAVLVRGRLVAAETDALLFSVEERQSDQIVVTRIGKLTGAWKSDANNYIVFEVEKEGGKKDVLTFRSEWTVNERHEIVYSWQETQLKKKSKRLEQLVFKGHWDVSEKNRLAYSMGGDSDSAFEWRGAFQTKGVLAKKGEIRYQLGAGSFRRRRTRTLTLFGDWKVSRDFALSFDIEYANGRKRAIGFGGDYSLDKSKNIAVKLRSERGKPLGLELILTQKFLPRDAEAFLRLQHSTTAESRIEAGATLLW